MGAVLYELVTGSRPFEGSQPFHLMLAHVEQPPKPPIELEPALPPPLSDAILTALQKQPDARFESVEQFQSALDAAVAYPSGISTDTAPNVTRKETNSRHGFTQPNGFAQPGGEPARDSATAGLAPRTLKPTGFRLKSVLLALSLIALVASLATFIVWRSLRPDPTKTIAAPSGNHRLLRKVIPEGTVQAIVFNAAGDLAAVLTSKGVAEVWEPESGEKRATFSGAGRGSQALALSSDARTIVFAGSDSRLRLWNIASGEEQLRLDAGSPVRSIAMSSNGGLLAAASDRFLTVWDIESARQSDPIHQQEYNARLVAFRPDGANVAVAGPDSVHVQRLQKSGAPSGSFAFNGETTALAFDPRKDLLAAAGKDGLEIWSSKTLEQVLTAKLPGPALALGFTRSGDCVALTSSGQLAQIWNAADGTEVSGFLHGYEVRAAALGPAGGIVATATTAGDLWFWKADPAWQGLMEPDPDPPTPPSAQKDPPTSRSESKPRKNVLRRFVDVFRR
jgi:WD40 repeat protein